MSVCVCGVSERGVHVCVCVWRLRGVRGCEREACVCERDIQHVCVCVERERVCVCV